MANTIGSTAYGPSWRDVGELLELCQKRWGGSWSVRITPRHSRAERGSVSVVCQRLRASDRAGDSAADCVCGIYPHSDYASLAVCMFNLLNGLDAKLEERKEQAERQMIF